MYDEIDKLKKTKNELQDVYYGKLIEFTKLQYLKQDVKWMTETQEKLKLREAEKQRIKEERQARIDAINKEKEERKQKEAERKQREEARKQAEEEKRIENEKNMRQNEIDQLAKLNEAILDEAVGNNPLFAQIETCEQLKKYVSKQMKNQKTDDDAQPAQTEEQKAQTKGELDKALQKGAIMQAPSKDQKNQEHAFAALASKKQKKSKKAGNADTADGQIDFGIVKKFNSLKIKIPMKEEDYEPALTELEQLRQALIYWGKII